MIIRFRFCTCYLWDDRGRDRGHIRHYLTFTPRQSGITTAETASRHRQELEDLTLPIIPGGFETISSFFSVRTLPFTSSQGREVTIPDTYMCKVENLVPIFLLQRHWEHEGRPDDDWKPVCTPLVRQPLMIRRIPPDPDRILPEEGMGAYWSSQSETQNTTFSFLHMKLMSTVYHRL